ncbi:MAG: hypothetical protein HFG07_09235 [Oscillibacter sp.]|nr:hypothetical protein [Oscillibacter sp.]
MGDQSLVQPVHWLLLREPAQAAVNTFSAGNRSQEDCHKRCDRAQRGIQMLQGGKYLVYNQADHPSLSFVFPFHPH